MNAYQKKLHKLCADGNTSYKDVSKYYFANESKFNATDTLKCCKHFMLNIAAVLRNAGKEFEKARGVA